MEYEKFYFCGSSEIPGGSGRVRLPEAEYSPEARRAADLKSRLLEINKKAAAFYYYQLKSEKGKQGSGISEKEGNCQTKRSRNSVLAVLPGIPEPCINI